MCEQREPKTDATLKSVLMYVTQNPAHIRCRDIGDWFQPNSGSRLILALDLGNSRYNYLLLLHEFYEQEACYEDGVHDDVVTAWDAKHNEGSISGGEDEQSPYHAQHEWAEKLERLAAEGLGVNWDEYEAAIKKAYGEVEVTNGT